MGAEPEINIDIYQPEVSKQTVSKAVSISEDDTDESEAEFYREKRREASRLGLDEEAVVEEEVIEEPSEQEAGRPA